MSIRYTGPEARQHAADVFRLKWFWFVLMGAVLIVAEIVAIAVPAVSSVPANEVLGSVLVFSGVVQILQAAKMLNGEGFTWHLLLGIVAAIGGVLIYLDPFPGIIAITVVIAIIFAVHGATQIVFAVKVNRHAGWHWFLVSGCVALIVSALLLMKLPYGHSFTPATVAGISLAVGGWAYVALALASRKNRSRS